MVTVIDSRESIETDLCGLPHPKTDWKELEFPLLQYLWAKSDPFHLLLHHCMDVGHVAAALLNTERFANHRHLLGVAMGIEGPLPAAWISYVAALHDIGKCDPDFQDKVPALTNELKQAGLPFRTQPAPHFRHEARSWSWVSDHLQSQHGWAAKVALTTAAAVRGHHGDFNVPCPHDDFVDTWGGIRSKLASELAHAFDVPIWSPQSCVDYSVFGMIVSGLIVMSDWIASNPDLFDVAGIGIPDSNYAAFSAQRASDAVSSLGLNDPLHFPRPARFSDVWTAPAFASPRPLQAVIEKLCLQGQLGPGLAIIEAPMGEGKTEAAVYLATQWMNPAAGFYVALPTGATSNQMHSRMAAFVEQFRPGAANELRLVHGMAWLIDDTTTRPPSQVGNDCISDAADWFRPAKRALLAPMGIGTIDQALMAVLHVKFGFLRLFGLAGAVLIVDEVHAYDAYMSRLLCVLLKWCAALKVPVILLSATLPENRKVDLVAAYTGVVGVTKESHSSVPYPQLTFAGMNGTIETYGDIQASSSRRLRLAKWPGMLGNAGATARLACDLTAPGGCTCVIANTVGSAQRIFLELQQQSPDALILLFHSRFTARNRSWIEQRVLELFDKRSLLPDIHPLKTVRPTRAILVATQVVEQSLDLDFDAMISELAPIDLLLQRAGRLHRHDRLQRPGDGQPHLHLLLPEMSTQPQMGPSEKVYARFVLLKTLAALHGREQVLIPEQIRELIEQVYDDIPNMAETCRLDSNDLHLAFDALCRDREDEKAQAGQYLIPEPYPPAFKLARMAHGSFEEEDGAASTYFNARTRLGDNSRRVLVLHDPVHRALVFQARQPSKALLRDLFLQMANIPAWWLQDAQPQPGFEAISTGPDWTRQLEILPMIDGVWRGMDKKSKPFVIRDDAVLGLTFENTGYA